VALVALIRSRTVKVELSNPDTANIEIREQRNEKSNGQSHATDESGECVTLWRDDEARS
jgi:hypothetical protein